MARNTREEEKRLQGLAETIYLSDDTLTQKDVAERVGITEKTLGKWITKFGWDKKRTSLLVTKKNQLVNLYNQLEKLNEEIKTRKIIYDVPLWLLKPVKLKDEEGAEYLHYHEYTETDYPVKVGNTPTSKEADTISKITSSIKKLETETNTGEMLETGIAFLGFVKPHNLDFAKQFSGYFDSFIQTKLNK
ncbi:helix-turn-helix domain-containing protein [Epilithonimonas vandammei]|uniref:Helix-turn-helix domain-containing protein n=1 Tax=Epilithonimonas vandammei TaxID=2487072 RepID=A0A3G8ZB18_9FLAO|nr:helix-turn-helix domain-containing protein [Epilithonimonas vandammei]AZI53895.1 helix-turn-helix domain-containing protein [Epilithonimonas vandammei]AZI55686.1 helix-turn-helix domain-containing protein [Epilithonimonas vandammei]